MSTQLNPRKIAFIGAGNMARSIFSGLLATGYDANLIIATRTSEQGCDEYKKAFGIQATTDNRQAIMDADVIVLGVKPQMMNEVCQGFSDLDLSQKLVISIAAGINCTRLTQMLGQTCPLIRVMPNTPSLVGYGMSGLYAQPNVSQADKDFTQGLMNAVGKTAWVEQESEINHIIAAAGSAPAYFFLFMQAMEEEATRLGFDAHTARTLVSQSALGAAHMVEANPELSLEALRMQVTSKGGTTAKAIETFQTEQLEQTVAKAMQAAITRAQEMEKQI